MRPDYGTVGINGLKTLSRVLISPISPSTNHQCALGHVRTHFGSVRRHSNPDPEPLHSREPLRVRDSQSMARWPPAVRRLDRGGLAASQTEDKGLKGQLHRFFPGTPHLSDPVTVAGRSTPVGP